MIILSNYIHFIQDASEEITPLFPIIFITLSIFTFLKKIFIISHQRNLGKKYEVKKQSTQVKMGKYLPHLTLISGKWAQVNRKVKRHQQ